jgi:hypothetical protein
MQELRNPREGVTDALDQRMPAGQFPPVDEAVTRAE